MRSFKEYERRESKANGDTYNGLEYDSEIVSAEGVEITLFVPKGTTRHVVEAAKSAARNSRDVVRFKTELPPIEATLITMTRHEFFKQFKPIPHLNAVHPLDDYEFMSAIDEENAFILKHANDPESELFVWTHAIDDDGNEYISEGYHLFHPIGYYLTGKAPEPGKQYFIQGELGGQDRENYVNEPGLEISGTCDTKGCKSEGFKSVPSISGDEVGLCDSCYDAYIIGLNRGMGMIVELPEQMKRSRIAELLREIRHLVEFDEMMSSQRDVGMAFGIGVCSALNTDRRTTEQLKRILLINMEK